ncbi:MAG: UDP-N-acetylmuramate--L-alanine ligase [Planctomycetes bacterium]|nr:UDP-N-acetylmuramate--L-alanine ligase [Planctomycetota bacterium]
MRPMDAPKWVHIVGIAGSATSGLARIMQAQGAEVTGSDREERRALALLRGAGVGVQAAHDARNVHPHVDLVVYSAAVPDHNPEIQEARRLGIPIVSYAECLGGLLREKRGIAVAGTHGKTSTAGMLASIFIAAGRDPSVLIGGEHPQLGGNWRHGDGPEFIAEACEFNRSFHSLHPAAGIVTNLELDHPDIYADEDAILESFRRYLAGFPPGATLVSGGDSPLLARVAAPENLRHLRFGIGSDNDWQACPSAVGLAPRFEIRKRGAVWGTVMLKVAGLHSVLNALAAAALAAELDVERAAIVEALGAFPGIARRFQRVGSIDGIDLVDDFAHHPTEVRSTLEAAREAFPRRPLWAVFQPHQHTRLGTFRGAFAEALAAADRVVLLPVYSVREAPPAYRDEQLALLEQELRTRGTPVQRAGSLHDGAELLGAQLHAGDVCLSLGAGDVYHLTEELRGSLERRGVAS